MRSALYLGEVRHHRLRPREHRFRYRVSSWLLDLDELQALQGWWPLLGINRAGLISVYEQDFGPAGDGNLKTRITALLNARGMPSPERLCLLCNPRTLGYGFNSLAVYFAYDADGELIATLYEVSNTRGERHLYITEVDSAATHRPRADKAMYVSPFMPMACRYRFDTQPPGERFRVVIHQQDEQGHLFSASWQGQRRELTLKQLLPELLRPMALKTSLAIHWEALRLWLKGVPLQPYNRKGSYRISLAYSEQEPQP